MTNLTLESVINALIVTSIVAVAVAIYHYLM